MSTMDPATRKALQDRRRILFEQPDVRWINLIETDGVSTSTRKHLVRVNKTKDMDHLKANLTGELRPPMGAIRNIYTPAGGTEVTSISQIQSQKSYVVGMGNQKYRQISQILKEHDENKKKILAQLERQKSQAQSDISNSNSSGPYKKRSIPPNRLSLMDRQDLIAQRSKGPNENIQDLTRRTPPGRNIEAIKKPAASKNFLQPKTKKITPNRKPLYPARLTSATATPPRRGKSFKRPNFKTGSQAVLAAKMNNNKGRAGLGGVATVVPVPVPISTGKSDSETGSESNSRSGSTHSRQTGNRTGKTGSRSSTRSGSRHSSGSKSGSRSGSASSKGSGSGKSDRSSRSGSGKSDKSMQSRRTKTGTTRASAVTRKTRRSVLTHRTESRSQSRSGSNESGKSGKSSRASSGGSNKSGKSSRASSAGSNKSGKSSQASSKGSNKSGKSGLSATSHKSRASSRSPNKSGKSSRASSAGSNKSSRASSVGSKKSRKSSPGSDRSNRSNLSTAKSGKSKASIAKSGRSNLTTSKSGRSNLTKSGSSSRASTSKSSASKSSHLSSRASTRHSTTSSRRSVASKKSDEILDDGSDTDDNDEKGKSHRLRYGSRFSKGHSARSHKVSVSSAGQGALNNDAPSPTFEIRDRSAFSFKSHSPIPSRANTRSLEVDYDTDGSGFYRAKSSPPETQGAREILDSSTTKVDLPIDLMPNEEVTEEAALAAKAKLSIT